MSPTQNTCLFTNGNNGSYVRHLTGLNIINIVMIYCANPGVPGTRATDLMQAARGCAASNAIAARDSKQELDSECVSQCDYRVQVNDIREMSPLAVPPPLPSTATAAAVPLVHS